MATIHSRREFLGLISGAGAGLALGQAAHAEPPPETTALRLGRIAGVCLAPQYFAEALLRAEGFAGIRYVEAPTGLTVSRMLASREIDLSMNFGTAHILPIDSGEPIRILAGVHTGCYELFAHGDIRSVGDLRGRRVGVDIFSSDAHIFLGAMARYVGLDPATDIDWVTAESASPKHLFIERKVDAFLAFPPEPQELRDKSIGHVIVSGALDRPWSQYFCCMIASSSAFTEQNPVATKRVIRAILKAADVCVSDPAKVARLLADGGYVAREDYALQALREIPYASWRELDPEDTVRFFSLRLHEAGMLKSSPQEIIAKGTDWRFLDDIKRELKT
jgi:NitT/TauT family transport system substrate-binding protein